MGSLQSRISKGSLDQECKQELLNSLDHVVTVCNSVKRKAQLAVEWLVTNILNNESMMNNPATNSRTGISLLDQMLFSDTNNNGGRNFWKRVVSLVYNGKLKDVPTKLPIVRYLELHLPNQFYHKKSNKDPEIGSLDGIFAELADDLDTDFAGLIIGNIPLLAARVLTQLESSQKDTIENAIDQLKITAIKNSKNLKSEHAKAVKDVEEQLKYKYDQANKSFLDDLESNSSSKVQLFKNLNDQLPVVQKLHLFPKSCISDSFVRITEDGLAALFIKKTRIGKNYPNLKKMAAGNLIQFCFGSQLGRNYSTLDSITRRYVMSNSISTNGFSIHVSMIDTARKKTRNSGKVSSGSLSQQATVVVSSKKESSSELEILSQEQVSDSYRIGVDFGDRYACGVFSICPNGEKRYLKLKSKALSDPVYKYKKWLESEKELHESLHEQERDLARRPNETIEDYAARYNTLKATLNHFYNSTKLKRHKSLLKRASQGEFDRALNAILKIVDRSMNHTAQWYDERGIAPVYFGFGEAQFESKSIGSSFAKYMIRRLRGLGYNLQFLDEFYTSQSCPR